MNDAPVAYAPSGEHKYATAPAISCAWPGRPAGIIGRSIARGSSSSAPVMRVASFDSPVPFAPNLEREVLPSKERLKKAIMTVLQF